MLNRTAVVGYIVKHTNVAVIGFVSDNQCVSFSQITSFENFEFLLSQQNIQLAVNSTPQSHPSYRVPTNKSFSQIEDEINSGETFLDRKVNIENKSETKKTKIQQKIQRLEMEIAGFSQVQLYQLLQDKNFDSLISENQIDDGRLLVYLVKNGYLDENYHLYISNFYEGRLTKNDRDFLLTIRSFNQPDPNQKIDTPKEVYANMRDEDFEHKYVLNVILIDHLLEIIETNPKPIEQAINYISQNFEQSEEFFTAYFTTGRHLEEFICTLSHKWPELATAAMPSIHGIQLVSYILRLVDADYISRNMNPDNLLTAFISEQGQNILASDLSLPDSYEVLKKLNVRFKELESLEKNKNLVEFAHAENLYTISAANLLYILREFANSQSAEPPHHEKENYTSILIVGSESLKAYVENNLQEYIEKVFLTLPENVDESEKSIKKLINHEGIDNDLSQKIISKQNHVFDSFDGIPTNLWQHLLSEEKVIVSWGNISEYFAYEEFNEEFLTEILERETTITALSNRSMRNDVLDEDNRKRLSKFILDNNVIEDANYFRLIKGLPYIYSDFPSEMSNEKIICLARERRVRLTEASYTYASGDDQLLAILVSKNFDEYLENKEKYSIDDDVRELLLLSEISDKNKIIICADVTPAGANESKELSNLIANLFVANEVDCSTINHEVLSSAIANAKDLSDSIKIIMKCISHWDEVKTMEVLAELPGPLSEIASYGKSPKIEHNKLNLELANLLETRGFISSNKEEGRYIRINTFKSREHS